MTKGLKYKHIYSLIGMVIFYKFLRREDLQTYMDELGQPFIESWIEHADGRIEALSPNDSTNVEVGMCSKLSKSREVGRISLMQSKSLLASEIAAERIAKLESINNLSVTKNRDGSFNVESLALALVANRERILAEAIKSLGVV